MTGVFSLVLKTAKAVPGFKKNSKLDHSNYLTISGCYKVLKKYMKNFCRKDYIPSSITIILSTTFSLIQTTIFYISCLN